MDEQIFNTIDEWIKKYRSDIGYSIPANEKLPFTLAELTYWMMNTKEQEFNRLSRSYYAISLLLGYQTSDGSYLLFQIIAQDTERTPRSVDYYVFARNEYVPIGAGRGSEIVDQFPIYSTWKFEKIERKVDEIYNKIVEKTALSKDEIKKCFQSKFKTQNDVIGKHHSSR